MRRGTAGALLVLAAGWAVSLWVSPFSDERVNDLFVYRTFAAPVLAGELPYRDVFLEYPPLAAPAIALPGLFGTGEEAFRWAFAGWTLLLGAAVVLLCGALAACTGGAARRALLAAALMPFLCGAMVRTHFDLAPVALVLGALLLLITGRERAGLVVLGLGAMTKGYPLVAAPVALAWVWSASGARAALRAGERSWPPWAYWPWPPRRSRPRAPGRRSPTRWTAPFRCRAPPRWPSMRSTRWGRERPCAWRATARTGSSTPRPRP